LQTCLFFELLWLDQYPAGTHIPPNNLAAAVASLAVLAATGITEPGKVVIVLVLCMPLALIGRSLEYLQRERQNISYNRLLSWVRGSTRTMDKPQVLISGSFFQILVMNLVFMAASVPLIAWLVGITLKYGHPPIRRYPLEWGHLWLFAAAFGLLSLRRKRAYHVAIASAAVIALFMLF